ncbi:cytochrome ubiquinol oxidase subunit I [Dactylosporangium vinaceum]|uniref:Cytochrome ubiquinol oxidase subunit I n=1 Tax=Dactylosporangium vinaceum TaxID=53362 RepID=A0ABV5MB24_9ACTN|nr:cytochrome ubiquinol oxidase subunit I [Dactylosporangium vinaceum]UAB98313.1 cytochrome ubiquinol oxidase subunit I [Dactylosporangium vinaceum]
MSALEYARMQFGLTASLHFTFVMVTLGLVVLVAVMQTRFVVTGQDVYGRMARFWGRLYAINYAVGIATGLVMEFEIGLNWSGLSRLTGDVFGAPLALETLVAFVLESTLLGMWIFGWGWLGKRLHLALIWATAATALLSAFWVMVSNAFLQRPVGYTIDAGGTARLTGFGALLTNSALWFALVHAVAATIVAGGVLVAGVSAWRLRRSLAGPDHELFRRSLRLGIRVGLIGTFFTIGFGYAQFGWIGASQPMKMAGGGERALERQAEMVQRFGPGNYLVSDNVGAALGFMVMVANLLFLILVVAQVLTYRDVLIRKRWARPVSWLLTALIPIPVLAALAGWFVREEGRQPWAVYGLLRTADAVSPMSAGALRLSTFLFSALVIALALADWWLLARAAARKPGGDPDAAFGQEDDGVRIDRQEVTV